MASMPDRESIVAKMEQRMQEGQVPAEQTTPTPSDVGQGNQNPPTQNAQSTDGGQAQNASGSESAKKPYGDGTPSGSTQAPKDSTAPKAKEELDESGHPVPYGRFKNVIQARNDLRSKLDAATAKIQEYEARLANGPQANKPQPKAKDPVDQWVDDVLGNDQEQSPTNNPWEPELRTTKQQLHAIQTHIEGQKLNAELADIAQKFPGVPRRALLEAVAKDSKVDLYDLAERFHTGYEQIRQQAIAEYLAEQTKAGTIQPQAKAAPPPVPPTVKTGGHISPNVNSGSERPRTMAEARKRALARFGITE